MVARLVRDQEVVGSSPVTSTIKPQKFFSAVFFVRFMQLFRNKMAGRRKTTAGRAAHCYGGHAAKGARLVPSLKMVCIFFLSENQNTDMRKIRPNPLNKTREERETCFPQAGREEVRP